MGITTKGSTPTTSFDVAKGNVPANGPPGQVSGPVLGPGDAGYVSPSDYRALTDKCDTAGHPVDQFSGAVLDDMVDLALPGPIPLVLQRVYNSLFADLRTELGIGGWTFNLAQWIEEDALGLLLRDEDSRYVRFASIQPGETTFRRAKRYDITRTGPASFSVYSLDTLLERRFSTEPGTDLTTRRALLRSVADRHGNQLQFEYDQHGIHRIIDTAGREVHFTYDDQGHLVLVQVWVAGQGYQHVSYGYHPTGELAWASNALNNADRYEYDAKHRMVKTTLKNGVSFYYEFDDTSGQCTKTWGDGGLHTYEFSRTREDDHVVVTASSADEPQVTIFNLRGGVLKKSNPSGTRVLLKEYDEDSFVLSESNAAGETTRQEFDGRGNCVLRVDSAGNATRWEYENDNPTRLTDAAGLETVYEYDAFGDVIAVRRPTGVAISYEYDRYGRLTAINGPSGRLTAYEYDAQHNVVAETDALGASWRYTYDPLGRPISREDPLGNVTSVQYDAIGQPIRVVYPDGSTKETSYHSLGGVEQSIEPSGATIRIEYIGTGRVAKFVQADGQSWHFHYDRSERLLHIHNPKGERYEFEYDDSGRVRVERTFDGRRLRYSYDLAGRVSRVDRPDGTWLSYIYDALGNLIENDSPHGLQRFERDPLGQIMKAVLSEGNTSVETRFERDRFGRVTAESQGPWTITYEFDSQGRRSKRTVPGCGTTEYGYDANDRLRQLGHESPTGKRLELNLERDALGREVAKRVHGARLEVQHSYDAFDRLIEQSVDKTMGPGSAARELLSRRTWKYDTSDNPTEVSDSRWGDARYGYDSQSQLTTYMRGNRHAVFEYQSNGTLARALSELSRDTNEGEPWGIGEGGLLIRTGTHSYEYDAGHRRTAKTSHSTGERTEYLWDCRDRLREVRFADGGRARYFYDALGRRVRKEVHPPVPAVSTPAGELTQPEPIADSDWTRGPRITEFLWDAEELAAELDSATGERGHVHVAGTFVPLLQVEGDRIFVVVTDHLGTPRDLVDEDGTVAWSAAYDPWGNLEEAYVAKPEDEGRLSSPFRFLGQYYDAESGLCSTRFRYWDAATANWCSPDPLGIDGGSTLFGHEHNPTAFVDPWGLASRSYQVGTMTSLNTPRDGFDNHEILQAGWLRQNPSLLRRTTPYDSRYGTVGGRNPAVAVRPSVHKQLNAAQRGLDLKNMTAADNIEHNLAALRRVMKKQGVGPAKINATIARLRKDAYDYARSVIRPCMHAAQGLA